MKEIGSKTKRVALLGVAASLALLLSYVEFLLPPLFVAVPGIKLGLPNVAILFVLYYTGAKEAIGISLIRVLLSAMLFGNAMTLAYSLAGAALSLAVMAALKKCNLLSPLGVSVAGAVAHNMGQTAVAVLLLDTPQIAYYMIVLTLTGIVTGAFVGLLGGLLLRRIPAGKL